MMIDGPKSPDESHLIKGNTGDPLEKSKDWRHRVTVETEAESGNRCKITAIYIKIRKSENQ